MTSIIPQTLEQFLWFILGFFFGRGFGKDLDYKIQRTEWFKRRHEAIAWIISRFLDSLHHFQIGILLMVYAVPLSQLLRINPLIPYWFGYGLLLDDIPDLWRRMGEWFKYLHGRPMW